MAEKGKIKVIKDSTGGIVVDRKGAEYNFLQPNYKELCLNEGDTVKFDLIAIPGAAQTAINVERLTAGTIVQVDPITGMGQIQENKSEKLINFFQPYPVECGCKVGELVKYNLISTDKGDLAVNLTGVGE